MGRDNFQNFWRKYKSQPLEARRKYVDSLSNRDRHKLFSSFFQDGWYDLFLQNEIDDILDFVKEKYNIDLIDMRIKILKYKKVFLIEEVVWDHIAELFMEYDSTYNTDLIFGGILVTRWGRHNQFYRISRRSSN